MPGSIAACAVSRRLYQVNFAGAVIRSDKAETEAFQASEGAKASRIQGYFNAKGPLRRQYRNMDFFHGIKLQ